MHIMPLYALYSEQLSFDTLVTVCSVVVVIVLPFLLLTLGGLLLGQLLQVIVRVGIGHQGHLDPDLVLLQVRKKF